jgi:hypothetical protein
LARTDITSHIIRKAQDLLVLTENQLYQVSVLEEVKSVILDPSAEAIENVGDLLKQCEILRITANPYVTELQCLQTDYANAQSLVAPCQNYNFLKELSYADLRESVNLLQKFELMIPLAPEALGKCLEWKTVCDEEERSIYTPLEDAFKRCEVRLGVAGHENSSGDFFAEEFEVGKRECDLLEKFLKSVENEAIATSQCQDLLEDALKWTHIVRQHASLGDAEATLVAMAGYTPKSDVGKNQFTILTGWAVALTSRERLFAGKVTKSKP